MANPRPNIILLVGEDAGRALGCYGDPLARTPHLDRLAAGGCRYDNAFTTSPVCSPSRATLVTGQYPWSLGTHHHRSKLLDPPRLFTQELREAGYYVNWANKTDFNFTPSADFADERRDWLEDLRGGSLGEKPFFLYRNIGVTHESTMWSSDEKDGHHEERLAKEHLLTAEQRVRAEDVRVPAYLPDRPEVRRNIARFYEAVAIADHEIGEVLETLGSSAYAENTVVIYLCDHGRGLAREKRWCYEAGLHLSLLVRWPGKIPAGSVNTELVSWVDLAPTILSIAGAALPAHYQGQVFLGPASAPPREVVFAGRDRMDESYDHVRVARDRRFHYIRNRFPQIPYSQRNLYMERMETTRVLRSLAERGELSGPEALWMAEQKPAEELYDVLADPEMVHNLALDPSFMEDLRRLSAALDQHLREVGDLGNVPERELLKTGRFQDTLAELYARVEPLPPKQRIGVERTVVEMPA